MGFRYVNFQFHYGSIRTLDRLILASFETSFQFHYGSIRTMKDLESDHFIKIFQFHYGSIRTETGWKRWWNKGSFNSIMVQLEPSGVALFKELEGSFNSIMVQLERSFAFSLSYFSFFQFHYGSIRTSSLPLSSFRNLSFNSIMVQLEHHFFCCVSCL